MKTILIPIDFTPRSDRLIAHAIELFPAQPLNIVLLHTYTIPERPTELVAQALRQCLNSKSLTLLKNKKRQVLDHYCNLPNLSIVTVSNFGKFTTSVVECTREVNAELVILEPHKQYGIKRLFNPSVTQVIIQNVKASVLVVPDEVTAKSPSRFKESHYNYLLN